MTKSDNTVQSKLKYLKRRYRLTNAALSVISGVPLATVNKLTTGEIKKPAFSLIEKIARAMNVSVKYFSCENEAGENAYIRAIRDSFTLTDEEYSLIRSFRGLPERQRRFAVSGINLLSGSDSQNEVVLPLYKTDETGKLKLTNVFLKRDSVSEKSDFALLVPDDELSPFYNRYDIIGFSLRKPLENELCLTFYAGSFFVRTLKHKSGSIILSSLCNGISPVIIEKGERLAVLGTVTGILSRT